MRTKKFQEAFMITSTKSSSNPSVESRLLSGMAALAALAILLTAAPSMAQRAAPAHLGGEAYTLTTGPLSVEVGPTKGARVRSLKFEGTELFYQDSSGSPPFHGSTFWPGPQAYWTTACRNAGNNGCWPPPTPFDGANTNYTGELLSGDTAVTYVSASHQATGIRLRKTTWANLEDTSISMRYHIVNTSANEVAFSPWEVTRFPSGGLLFWPRSEQDIATFAKLSGRNKDNFSARSWSPARLYGGRLGTNLRRGTPSVWTEPYKRGR
jgi:hypothetical protein